MTRRSLIPLLALALSSGACSGGTPDISTSMSSQPSSTVTEGPLTTAPPSPPVVEMVLVPEPLVGDTILEVDLSDPSSPFQRPQEFDFPWSFEAVDDRVYWIDASGSSLVVFDRTSGQLLDRLELDPAAQSRGLAVGATDIAILASGLVVVKALIEGEGFLIVLDPNAPSDYGLYASEPVKRTFLNARLASFGDDVYVEGTIGPSYEPVWIPVLVDGAEVDEPDRFVEVLPKLNVGFDTVGVSLPGHEWILGIEDVDNISAVEQLQTDVGVAYLNVLGLDPSGAGHSFLVELAGSEGRAWEIGFLPGDYTRRFRVTSDGSLLVAVVEGSVLRLVDLVR